MRITLVGAAVAVFCGAVVAIASFNSDGRLGRLMIAIIASLALGAIDGRYAWLEARRHFWADDQTAYHRYLLRSLGLVAGAAAILIGLAWFLP